MPSLIPRIPSANPIVGFKGHHAIIAHTQRKAWGCGYVLPTTSHLSPPYIGWSTSHSIQRCGQCHVWRSQGSPHSSTTMDRLQLNLIATCHNIIIIVNWPVSYSPYCCQTVQEVSGSGFSMDMPLLLKTSSSRASRALLVPRRPLTTCHTTTCKQWLGS